MGKAWGGRGDGGCAAAAAESAATESVRCRWGVWVRSATKKRAGHGGRRAAGLVVYEREGVGVRWTLLTWTGARGAGRLTRTTAGGCAATAGPRRRCGGRVDDAAALPREGSAGDRLCGVRFERRRRRRGCRMRIAQGVGVCACVRGRRRTSSLSLGLCFAVWLFEWVCACVPRCWACAHKASACTMHSSDVLSSHIRPARAGLHGRSCPAAYAHERCCRMYRAGCRDRLRHPRRRRHRRRAQDVCAGAGRGVIGWARGARESAGAGGGWGQRRGAGAGHVTGRPA